MTESGFSRVELHWFAKHKTEPPVECASGRVGFGWLTESGFSRVELRLFAKHKTEPRGTPRLGGGRFWTVDGKRLQPSGVALVCEA